MHYKRWVRTGDPLLKGMTNASGDTPECLVDGCHLVARNRGFCREHRRMADD